MFRSSDPPLGIPIPTISGGVADLTPLMCARLRRHTPSERRVRLYRWAERAFDRIIAASGTSLRWVARPTAATLAVAASPRGSTLLR